MKHIKLSPDICKVLKRGSYNVSFINTAKEVVDCLEVTSKKTCWLLSSSGPQPYSLFWHSLWHTICTVSIYWVYVYIYKYSDIPSDILSGIYSDILSDILSCILSGILSDIYSGILSGVFPGILFWRSLCPGLAAAHSVRISRWDSGYTATGICDIRFGSSRSLASGARAMRFGDELAQKWTREKSRRKKRKEEEVEVHICQNLETLTCQGTTRKA